MDPLDGIAAFARVVDSGSFSAAARRLKISKSAVSAHVHRLEGRLGVRLLNRTTRRLSVIDGIGIAVLPSWAVAQPLRTGTLHRVLEAWAPPASTIYAVYPDNRLMSMKVRAFVDHLARHVGRTPYWDAGL
ncbi:LysR family transcriptional regulator [Vineibacter terrae]|uniref:LysR family transcriptional regulator n=1 Tax=Vineibacter terrae TaxID=2586908 RepID=A0A5C8PF74_9HYPH|nr:LysR family transcriptional regulator [Vineibacter terrae]TXL72430.1 LysR family transcriptional regulator [Vineibacter terrae]